MAKSSFVYVTYIRTTPEKLWSALTDPEFTQQYWFGVRCESEWKAGSSWKLISDEGTLYDAGKILEAEAPKRLVIHWEHQNKPELREEGASICIMELQPEPGGVVKLTITHSMDREGSKLITAVSGGWPKILSNLKSLLETGSTVLLPTKPASAEVRA